MNHRNCTAVGVHPSNYSKMEKGERDVSIEVADKLAVFFWSYYRRACTYDRANA